MIVIHVVGDGPRDEATVPHLIESILGEPVQLASISGDKQFEQRRYWKKLRVAGYTRKLLFAIQDAIDAQAAGVVAVIDRDTEPSNERMEKLKYARDFHRTKNAPFPTVLGEAIPHGEAWFLDDPRGVRQALGLASDHGIVDVLKSNYPKSDLDNLIKFAELEPKMITNVLSDIAKSIDVARCNHAKQTGLHDFVSEIKAELGPLVALGKGGRPVPGEHPTS